MHPIAWCEVEWGILTALGAADPDTTPVPFDCTHSDKQLCLVARPRFSICHDLQVVEPAQLNADMNLIRVGNSPCGELREGGVSLPLH